MPTMTLIHSALMVPTFIVSATFFQSKPGSASIDADRNLALPKVQTATVPVFASDQTRFVSQRKLRVERILSNLDSVATATQQMKPEMSERIEPVIVDLAEQAIELSTDQALRLSSTDAELTKLEFTITQFVHTMTRLIEPEVSL